MTKLIIPSVWLLIPARGGSKTIPRKNLRLLADKPLLLHILEEAHKIYSREQIIVSTDDEEISQVVKDYAQIHVRPSHLATDSATLDVVALEVAHWLLENKARPEDTLLTVQPTSPFLRVATIQKAVECLQNNARSVITVKDDRHLRWTRDENGNPQPLFTRRVNRQWQPVTLAETGGIIGTHIGDLVENGTRILHPITLLEVDRDEGLDIDTYADWAVAEFLARQQRIVIRADASKLLGMGHVYRALALAQELNEHNLKIVTRKDDEYQLGADFFAQHPYPLETIDDDDKFLLFLDEFQPHIVILDILDTAESFILSVKARSQKVVSLEDLGAGAYHADVVINDLYTDLYPQQNHWYGVQHAVLGVQFETVLPRGPVQEVVETILIAFGGTDPLNLTAKTLAALSQIAYQGEVIVVLGPGYVHDPANLANLRLRGKVLKAIKNMAWVMREADLAITSAGRTVTELMSLGIPTLVMCQNTRELRHTHASGPYGVINLGLGEHVAISTLAHHIDVLLQQYQLRQDMQARALQAVKNRSNRQIVQRILETISQ